MSDTNETVTTETVTTPQMPRFTMMSRDALVLAVIRQIYDDYEQEKGVEALIQLLSPVGINRLVDYLPKKSGVKLIQAQTIIKECNHVDQN